MPRAKQEIDYGLNLAAILPKGQGDVAGRFPLSPGESKKLEAVAKVRAGAYVLKPKKDNPDGPTDQRLSMASGSASIGDDKQGTRIYHMMDSPLDRLYGRLVRAAKTENQTDRLRVEYAALTRYHRLFVESGMVGSVGSVDPNRTYSPNPAGRTFLAASEYQCDMREDYRRAVIHLDNHPKWGHKQTIVVDNVVCHQHTLQVAGYSIGKSPASWAHTYSEKILRDAGWRLAVMWGMVR